MSDDYIAICEAALRRGEFPPDARTYAEVEAAMRAFPDLSHYWRPADDELERGREAARFMAGVHQDPQSETVEPLDRITRRRFVATLATDPEFASVIGRLIGG